MKKLLMLAVVLGLAATVVGCGPTATGTTKANNTSASGSTSATEVKK